jgi:uncharacterized membrane protein
MGPYGWGFLEGVGSTIGFIVLMVVIVVVVDEIRARWNAAGGGGNHGAGDGQA